MATTTKTIELEKLVNWSEAKRVNTKHGPRLLRKGHTTELFWDAWKQHKQTLKDAGISCGKNTKTGEWEATWWQLDSQQEEQRSAAIEASRAASTDFQPPCPAGLEYLPYQRAGIQYALGRQYTLIADSMGLGKEQPLTAKILTPSGWSTMGEMRVGSRVIGSDGKAHKVTGVYPQGKKPVYRVTFSDNSFAECGLDHLWKIRDQNRIKRGTGWDVISTRELIARGTLYSDGTSKYQIPRLPAVQFDPVDLPIDPYVLGVLLGDGCLCGSSICWSTPDVDYDIVERMRERLPSEFRITKHDTGGCMQYLITTSEHKSNYLKNELRKLDLLKKSKEKFIPEIYLLGSIEQRLDLLRGLMDTDGSRSKRNSCTFCSCSKKLSVDFVELARSLGAIASVRTYHPKDKPTEYRIRINSDFCPFYSKRKAKDWKKDTKNRGHRIVSIDYIGEAEQQCIAVDAPDHLYVTDGYKLTHNTVQAIGVWNSDSTCKKCLIVCPASLRLNWKREFEKWSVRPVNIAIVDGGKPADFPKGSFDVLIINYDVLNKHRPNIDKIQWDLLIADECHLCKNQTTMRTKALYGFENYKEPKKNVPPIQAKRGLFLTGTPIVNRPVELWPLVHRIDPKGLGRIFFAHDARIPSFTRRFCDAKRNAFGWDFTGASNLDELQNILRERFMVRRLKEDVLKELPPKRRQVIEIPANGASSAVQQERQIFDRYSDYLEELDRRIAEMEAECSDVYRDELERLYRERSKTQKILFTEISKASHEVALAKVPHVIEHLEENLENGPIVCFAHHRDVIQQIKDHFKDRAVTITGDTNMADRQTAVDRFQAGEVDLFIGNIQAAGVGITLTKSSHVVFAELDWVPGNMNQCEDRTHRIGQLNSVLVQHIVLEDSVDALKVEKLIQKQEVIDKALDREAPTKKQTETQSVEIKKEKKQTPKKIKLQVQTPLTESEIKLVHAGLRSLSGMCDGAREVDDRGFNKLDSHFGRTLALEPNLTSKQARTAAKMLIKYKRQLPMDVWETCKRVGGDN